MQNSYVGERSLRVLWDLENFSPIMHWLLPRWMAVGTRSDADRLVPVRSVACVVTTDSDVPRSLEFRLGGNGSLTQ